MHYDWTGEVDTGYEAWFDGAIADRGYSMSGTWSDTGSNTDQSWNMTRQ